MCSRERVPLFRFLCDRCYRSVPIPMRRAGEAAWRDRVIRPRGYAETLASILIWYRNRHVDDGR